MSMVLTIGPPNASYSGVMSSLTEAAKAGVSVETLGVLSVFFVPRPLSLSSEIRFRFAAKPIQLYVAVQKHSQ